MPIFEIVDGALKPFARVQPGADLYEQEIEALIWADLEAFTGETLFPVARQARIAGGTMIPDIVALDSTGRVVVIEVKRDVDRSQLAQCLEYAGWARLTNLDEIAGLYRTDRPEHSGAEAFFRDWSEFTDSSTPTRIVPQPRLILVARDFPARTRSALDFLRENGLPVVVIPVTIYADADGRRVVDIEADHEPDLILPEPAAPLIRKQVTVNGRRVSISDLLAAGLLVHGERVDFIRPRRNEHHEAIINGDGTFTLADGTVHQSCSLAAMRAADMVSCDGWHAWRVVRLGGVLLHELRLQYIAAIVQDDEEPV